MTLPNRTRLAKGKLEIKEVRKEKQTVTSKNHDKNCFKVENVEVSEDVDLLKQLNDALLEEVKNNEEAIENLKKKEEKYVNEIKELKQKIEKCKKTQDLTNTGTQTQFADIRFCAECEYPADDLYALGEHMGEDHADRNVCESCDVCFDDQENLVKHVIKEHMAESNTERGEECFYCNFCHKKFKEKHELMIHKKAEHTDKVSKCWNYSTGACLYGETNCWFIHAGQLEVPEINCKLCNEQFFSKRELQQHKRYKHPNTVLSCSNILIGDKCLYGKFCWFKHDEKETNETNEENKFENSEVGKRIFTFMEKIDKKLNDLEQNSVTKN